MVRKRAKGPHRMVPVVIAALFLGAVGLVIHLVLSDRGGLRIREQVHSLSLLKPPPMPEKPLIREKPPEPERVKQENLEKAKVLETMEQSPITPMPRQAPGPGDDSSAPPGDQLGVDAEGGSGSDSFGLVGRKGGRGLIGGGGGGGGGSGKLSLFAKYGWYTKKIQDEVRAEVKRRLDREGGFPKGKLQTVVRVVVDDKGIIVASGIVTSSGLPKMDDAVIKSLEHMRIGEPPPEGMPRGMTLRIASQG